MCNMHRLQAKYTTTPPPIAKVRHIKGIQIQHASLHIKHSPNVSSKFTRLRTCSGYLLSGCTASCCWARCRYFHFCGAHRCLFRGFRNKILIALRLNLVGQGLENRGVVGGVGFGVAAVHTGIPAPLRWFVCQRQTKLGPTFTS